MFFGQCSNGTIKVYNWAFCVVSPFMFLCDIKEDVKGWFQKEFISFILKLNFKMSVKSKFTES